MKRKLILIPLLAAAVSAAVLMCNTFSVEAHAAEKKTGVGLSDHVLMAKAEGWKYIYGTYGNFSKGIRTTDCSGLIKSYLWWTGPDTNPKAGSISVAGGGTGMLNSASVKGKINYSDRSSLPNIHGLILHEPGHVGVYVGNNMAVDNRGPGENMKHEAVFGRKSNKWVTWFKLPQIAYPATGWATFNGNDYYYEGGAYITDTTRTLGSTVYAFAKDGTIAYSTPTDGAAVDAMAQTAADAPVNPEPAVAKATPPVAAPAAPAAPETPKPVAVAAKASAYSTLKIDSNGDSVKKLQNRLSMLGYYYEAVNNYYDYCTQDAVSEFQRVAGLEDTGTADSKTQEKLFAADAPKNPAPGKLYKGLHSGKVTELQKRLMALGYMSGETSSYFGDATKAGVIAYQKAAGLKETGELDTEAQKVLYSNKTVKKEEPVSSASASSAVTSSASASSVAAAAVPAVVSNAPSAPAVSEPVVSAPEESATIFAGNVPTAAANKGTEQQRPNSSNTAAFIAVLACAALATFGFFWLRRRLIAKKVLAKAPARMRRKL